ncbi:MAG: hypothetical protein IT204_24270 [Fimbriimonadaceae bacterium]|nr:hypothetical protein [Fimbriimonadaceae bacterium]
MFRRRSACALVLPLVLTAAGQRATMAQTNETLLPQEPSAGPAGSASATGRDDRRIVVTGVSGDLSGDAVQIRGIVESLLRQSTCLDVVPHEELIRRLRDDGLQAPDRLDAATALQAARDARVAWCASLKIQYKTWVRQKWLPLLGTTYAPAMECTVTVLVHPTTTPEEHTCEATGSWQFVGPESRRPGTSVAREWVAANLAPTIEAALQKVSPELARRFPPVYLVKGVNRNGDVVIDRANLPAGAVLELFTLVAERDEKGQELYTRSETLGTLVVTEGLPEVSLCQPRGKLPRPARPGDRVRLVQLPAKR